VKNFRPATSGPKNLKMDPVKSVVRHGVATSADKEGKEELKAEFEELMEEQSSLP
jgi:hypothetical protein